MTAEFAETPGIGLYVGVSGDGWNFGLHDGQTTAVEDWCNLDWIAFRRNTRTTTGTKSSPGFSRDRHVRPKRPEPLLRLDP